MSSQLTIAANLVAITILVFGLYFPRYHRKDMVVAILGLNVGVMAVATALSSVQVSAGFGLGLFGILSIIRLRSSELAQEEVAYYFTALALGLLAGFELDPAWMTPVLMGAILGALFIGDHPRLFARSRHQNVNLDRAHTDERQLAAALAELLNAEIMMMKVKKVDLVNDTTSVDVRYRLLDQAPTHESLTAVDGFAPAGHRR